MKTSIPANKGFSLVELMVAMVAGLIVSSAVISFTMSSMKSNGEYVLSTRLTQELRNTLDLVTRDLRRAGYDDNAMKYFGNDNVSPFSPIHVETATEADGSISSCVIYAYDRSFPNFSSTPVGTIGGLDISNGEVRGIRRKLVTSGGRTFGVIEYAVSAGTTKPQCGDAVVVANYSSMPGTCDPSTGNIWCPLSDARNLNITGFNIVYNFKDLPVLPSPPPSPLPPQMRQRWLDVTLTGSLANTNEFVRDVRTTVKVRADCTRAGASFAGACGNVSP
jgi:prepilin-type N-terminal cleavage/methylation domain-containing protein